jgi:phenylacetate-coenzyme A ligase PaaK-like adenylate-forming protein
MPAVKTNLGEYPFYRERLRADGRPVPWTIAELEAFAAAHPDDPYAGRTAPAAAATVSLQIEATGEPPIWTALDSAELDRWAGVLARIWARWGTARGETIAFFEYGSSPIVLLASGGYVAYLRRGAAERLGLTAVCNDGVATMAARMVGIVQSVHPAMLVLRRELVTPFAAALESSAVSLANQVRWVGLSEVEGAPAREEAARVSATLGVPVHRILRCDAGFLLAGECPGCGAFHLDRLYRAETLASHEVAVTARFAHSCPAVRYNLGAAELLESGCPLEPRAQRIRC